VDCFFMLIKWTYGVIVAALDWDLMDKYKYYNDNNNITSCHIWH
jgi:hypothetical protein